MRLREQAHSHCDCARSQDRTPPRTDHNLGEAPEEKTLPGQGSVQRYMFRLRNCENTALEASSGAGSDPEILAMDTPQDSCQNIQKPPSLGAEEDQEQQHGEYTGSDWT